MSGKTGKRLLFFYIILLCCSLSVFSLTFKIGSTAPAGTAWDDALKDIAAEWEALSDGDIRLVIYPGGVAGTEGDMIRKMRIGQLQGAALSGIGLTKISRDMLILSLPRFVRSEEELDFLLDTQGEAFEALLEDKGFHLIAWQMAGWINFFSRKPVRLPEDLKDQKLSVTADTADLEAAWKESGFRVVPLDTQNIMTGLQTGMIDAFYNPPVMAASYQWFALAPHMCSLTISPLLGGFVIDQRAWSRVPEDLKEPLLEAARRIAEPLYGQIIDLEQRAISIMRDNGLTIHELNAREIGLWEEAFRRGYDTLLDTVIDADLFTKIDTVLQEYRKKP
ncbi:MAG: TRAP transporter substrate-binding protein DctP [Spirochaetales bacterium]|nr:TRAP transporter substrate-binding protein DctP [Spirochaetales bacterium]